MQLCTDPQKSVQIHTGVAPSPTSNHTTPTAGVMSSVLTGRPTSSTESKTAVTSSSLPPSGVESQKLVLNSLKSTIERSLPPVPLHAQTLTLQRSRTSDNLLTSGSHPVGFAGANSSSVYLRFAHPLAQRALLENRRTYSSSRTTHMSSYANGPMPFQVQFKTAPMPPKTTFTSARSTFETSAHKNAHDVTNDTTPPIVVEADTDPQSRPKSILRKEKSDVTEVCGRKSVRFNYNDSITHFWRHRALHVLSRPFFIVHTFHAHFACFLHVATFCTLRCVFHSVSGLRKITQLSCLVHWCHWVNRWITFLRKACFQLKCCTRAQCIIDNSYYQQSNTCYIL